MFIHSLDNDVPPSSAPSPTIEKDPTNDPTAGITSSILEDEDDTSCKGMYEVNALGINMIINIAINKMEINVCKIAASDVHALIQESGRSSS